MRIPFIKLSDQAIAPTNNYGDAGYDLYSVEDYTLKPMERKLFKTDISMAIPSDYFGRIVDRSGNALKKGLHVVAGVVDSIYRGEVGVVLVNLNYGEVPIDLDIQKIQSGKQTNFSEMQGQNVEIKKGDRIAQIIFQKYADVTFYETVELPDSSRGEKGFGSSGE